MISILGISCFFHDSAAVLIIDGKIIGAVQEERFTRKKHDSVFPTNSINYLIKENNISLDKIDYFVFYEKPFLKFERILETFVSEAPYGLLLFCKFMPLWIKEKLFQKKLILNKLSKITKNKINENKIFFSEHHLSHAASAFYPSNFDEAAIITLDGVGEWTTTTIAYGKNNKIKFLKEINFPHSLGLFYSAFTYFLGFKVNSGEYKVMGLAPYGKPKFSKIIKEKIIFINEDGSFKLNMKYFNFLRGLTMTNKKFETLFDIKKRNSSDELLQIHMDIAASVQFVLEEIVLKICEYTKKITNTKNITMAGGVALNCVANSKILQKKIFKNIWIQPASGDAGGALGAALAFWYEHLKNDRKKVDFDHMSGSYLGTSYSNEKIINVLNNLGATFKSYNEEKYIDIITDALIDGKAIGWFNGRMEFGPRALGSRSIIADPRSEFMQKELNIKIKFREGFRPFAPAIMLEKLNQWFEFNVESPYMLLIGNLKENKKIKINKYDERLRGLDKLKIKRSIIPAVTHVDYTARIQTVKKETNEKFYNLINNFYRKTGCPVLVNTSFNIRGEPIVNSPEDAFNCFMGTNLDILAIGNTILFKSKQKKSFNQNYKDNFELD